MESLSEMVWIEKTSFIDKLLEQELTISNLPAGLEADVWKLSSNTDSAVLKIWSKDSNPDVHYQYHMLAALRDKGVSVSSAYGWGYMPANHKALVTSYDGSPLTNVTDQHAKDFADLLLQLHQVTLYELDPVLQRKYDFIPYFFPRLEEHPDIQTELLQLVNDADLQQDKVIHGDLNLGNILVTQGKYIIIDWTNVQLGDARYDLAWMSFLIRINNGEELASILLHAYLSKSDFQIEEVRRFEAIACLRLLLLHRIADLPKNENAIERLNDFIMKNKYLNNNFVLV
ncbi:aminoglycoside phosphotransferase family protein [Paenibacillus mendelii]|uniref:Aminoglycoside phosphotransferase family protein n=1 Tax=Paenibacillus mendelii TaxID=206163 RepID=A0ABV6J563_9BACL|nr:aminoglycoside phosphotransferase family protein [Paenibacillus mendelii]MCQ6563298.1 aminoglycoside phosphotransferase family protein [Paenibacillus mendelii]